jgi:hypothetical protein
MEFPEDADIKPPGESLSYSGGFSIGDIPSTISKRRKI